MKYCCNTDMDADRKQNTILTQQQKHNPNSKLSNKTSQFLTWF